MEREEEGGRRNRKYGNKEKGVREEGRWRRELRKERRKGGLPFCTSRGFQRVETFEKDGKLFLCVAAGHFWKCTKNILFHYCCK